MFDIALSSPDILTNVKLLALISSYYVTLCARLLLTNLLYMIIIILQARIKVGPIDI